jgi:hypothetical protein
METPLHKTNGTTVASLENKQTNKGMKNKKSIAIPVTGRGGL